MFHGPFWTKNSIVTVILQFNFIWTQKCEIQFMVRSKISKKVKISFFKQRRVFDAKSPQQSNDTISFPVRGLEL